MACSQGHHNSSEFNTGIHIPSCREAALGLSISFVVSTLLENVSQICQISTTTQALFKDVRTHPFTRVNPFTFASVPVIGPSG